MVESGCLCMFMGEYNHTIDTKGRLIIPSKYRDQLGEEFVLTKGLEGCLFVYPTDAWEEFAESLEKLPLTKKDARKYVRFFMSGAAQCEIDKQGRILVPPVLREYAGLDKEVVLAGVGKRIEIWDRAKWNECALDGNMDEIAENLEDLGIGL